MKWIASRKSQVLPTEASVGKPYSISAALETRSFVRSVPYDIFSLLIWGIYMAPELSKYDGYIALVFSVSIIAYLIHGLFLATTLCAFTYTFYLSDANGRTLNLISNSKNTYYQCALCFTSSISLACLGISSAVLKDDHQFSHQSTLLMMLVANNLLHNIFNLQWNYVLISWLINFATLCFISWFTSTSWSFSTIVVCLLSLYAIYEQDRYNLALVHSITCDRSTIQDEIRQEIVDFNANVSQEFTNQLQVCLLNIDNLRSSIKRSQKAVENHISDMAASNDNMSLINAQSDCNKNVITNLDICSDSCESLYFSTKLLAVIKNISIDSVNALHGKSPSVVTTIMDISKTFQSVIDCIENNRNNSVHVICMSNDVISNRIITCRKWVKESVLSMVINAIRDSNENTVVSIRYMLRSFDGTLIESKSDMDKCHGPSFIRIEVEDCNASWRSEESALSMFHSLETFDNNGFGFYALANRMKALGGRYGVEQHVKNTSMATFNSVSLSNTVIAPINVNIDDIHGTTYWIEFPYHPVPECPTKSPLTTRRSKTLETSRTASTNSCTVRDICEKQMILLNSENGIFENKCDEILPAIPVKSPPNTATHDDDDDRFMRNWRVLVVDDDPIIRNIISKLLFDVCKEIVLARDGLEALSIFSSQGPFHVVLTDIYMPRMNGITLISLIRKKLNDFQNESILIDDDVNPICLGMINGQAMQQIDLLSMNHEFDALVAKPFSLTQFLLIIDECRKKQFV